jgi:hypothetical protein
MVQSLAGGNLDVLEDHSDVFQVGNRCMHKWPPGCPAWQRSALSGRTGFRSKCVLPPYPFPLKP